jgi:hypothetical protein
LFGKNLPSLKKAVMNMWSALKSDLLDFVTTIQEDTSKTLSLVLGDEEVDVSAEEENLLKKWIADTKRSYETYANPLKERRAKEFERYKKKFTLTMHSNAIAEVLDEEPEVSRFYAELVPIHITPDEFWARLFFRLQLLTRTGNVNFEEDDEEEELTWEETDVVSDRHNDNSISEPGSAPTASSPALVSSAGIATEEKKQYERKIQTLEDENQKLRNMLSSLTNRIALLELDVKSKNELIANLQEEQSQANRSSGKAVPASAEPATAAPLSSTINNTAVPTSIVPPTSDTWSEASSEGLLVNHSDANSLTYGTDEESSRHGVGGKATLIMSSTTPAKSTTAGALHSTIIGNNNNNNTIQQNNHSATPKNVATPQVQMSTFLQEEDDEEEDGWN